MTTISAPDLTKLRTQTQYSTLYLSALQPDALLVARLNGGAVSRGDRSFDYDGGTGTAAQFARITAGMSLWVGSSSGTNDIGKVRVKSIAGDETSGTITIAENGLDLINDAYLIIYDFYDIWPIPPRIDTNGVQYKDYDDPYVDENEEPPPVAIMGPHRAGFLSSGSLVFTLDGSGSYAIANGASVTGYAWTATGGAIANAAIATTTITFNTAGYYWVTLTVTDDNGKTQLTRRCYFVYDNSDTANQPYRDFTISSCGGDWNSAGWQFSAEVYGDVTLDDFPDGTLILLWHQNYIDGSADNVNIWDIGDEIICAGYLQRDVDTDDLADSGTGSVSLTVVSPTIYLGQKNIMGTVALEANSNPNAWNEYATWLSAGRAIHHLLRWHSTIIETCDVLGLTDNTLQVYQVAFTEDSLLGMVNQFAFERGIFAKLVSAKDGRLYFVEDSNYLDEADRAAQDTVFTIVAQDLAGTPQLAREPLEQTSLVFLDGYDYDGSGTGDPYVFLIPGYIDTIGYPIPEFWGRGNINKSRQILDSQADGEMKTGRVLAVANNPLRELRLDFRSNYLGAVDIIPSIGWYRWGIANATPVRGLALLNTDWLCRRVELRFPVGDLWPGAIQVSAIFEGEAFGEDGIVANYPTSYPTPTPPEPNWDIANAATGLEALLAAGSVWYRNQNATDWTEINSTDGWTYITVDPFWSTKNSNSTPQNVIYWTIKSDGLYRTDKTSGTPVLKNIANDPPDSFSDTPDITTGDLSYIHFLCDQFVQNQGFALVEAQNGASEYRGWIARTTTDGVSWEYGNLYQTTAPDEIRPIWLAVNSTHVLITIYENDSGTEKLWLVKLLKSDLSWVARYDLGVCAAADLYDTRVAYPAAALDDDDYYLAYGRMNEPGAVAGSSNPEHIIGTDDDGSTWSSIENGQGVALVLALEIDDNNGGNRTFSAALRR